MRLLDYCRIPGHHRAFAYTKAEHMTPDYLAETFARFRREHTADDLVPRHAQHVVGDDYDRVHRDDWLSAPGGFK